MKGSLTRYCAMLGLYAVVSTAVSADDTSDARLWAVWATPGGNIVQIERRDGQWVGNLVKVTRGSREYGFSPGQTILKDFQIDGDRVCFKVAVREQPSGDQATEPDYLPFCGELGDQALGGRLDQAEERELILDDSRTTDTEVTATYRRLPVTIEPPAIGPVYRLVKAGPGEDVVRIEANAEYPFGADEDALSVKVQMVDGSAVELTEVEWTVSAEGRGLPPVKYKTVSDRDGKASLVLGLRPNGEFVPVNQISRAPRHSLIPGSYEVTARVPQLDESVSMSFRARLSAGPILAFMSEDGSEFVSQLLYTEADRSRGFKPFRVRINHKGLADSPPESLRASLNSYRVTYTDGGEHEQKTHWGTTQVTLRHSGNGIYELGNVIEATPGRVDPIIRSDRVLLIPNRYFGSGDPQGIVEVSMTQPDFLLTNTLRLYSSKETLWRDYARKLLLEYRTTIDELRRSAKALSGDEQALLAHKEALIRRGLALLDERFAGKVVAIGRPSDYAYDLQHVLGMGYVKLVSRNCRERQLRMPSEGETAPPDFEYRIKPDCYGRVNNGAYAFNTNYRYPRKAPMSDYVKIPHGLEAERRMLRTRQHHFHQRREQRASRLDLEDLYASLLGDAAQTAKIALPQLVSSPFYMVHAMAYGTNLHGQRLTGTDRLLVGLEIASYRLGTTVRMRSGRQHRSKQHLIEELHDAHSGLSAGAGFDFTDALNRRRFRAFSEEMLEEIRFREIERLLRVPMPEHLRNAQIDVLAHVTSYRLGDLLRQRLQTVEAVYGRVDLNSARHGARTLGSIQHLVQYHKERAFFRSLPNMRETGQRFRQIRVDADGRPRLRDGQVELGPLEVMLEWHVPIPDNLPRPASLKDRRGIRIDRVEVMHEPITLHGQTFAGQVRIVDLVRDLNWTHAEKTRFYRDVLETLPHPTQPQRREFDNYLYQVSELEWNEQSGEWLQGSLAAWYQPERD